MEQKIKGIVTAIKYAPEPVNDRYTVLSSKLSYCNGNGSINIGDTVEFNDVENPQAVKIEGGQSPAYKAQLSRLLNKIYTSKNMHIMEKRYTGNVLEAAVKMLPLLDSAARVFLRSLVTGAPIVVRFHNDGDGSSGATALYKAVCHMEEKLGMASSIAWRMSRSIAYSIDDLYYDEVFFKGYKSVEKPVIVIIDFGTNRESEESIMKAKESYELIMLDHHMPYEGFEKARPELYISPWDFGSNSNFTAGALATIFAELVSGLKLDIFEKASFISDFSNMAHFKIGSKPEKLAVVLDYITSIKKSSSKVVTPSYIDSIISDKEKLESTYTHAKNLMSEAIDAGIRAVKIYNTGYASVHVVDFGHVVDMNNDYPLPGRYSSALQQKFETIDNGPSITIVHYGNFISIRISKAISDKVDILGKINLLDKETDGQVSGGGHKEAASIRAGEANIGHALRRMLELLGVSFNKM